MPKRVIIDAMIEPFPKDKIRDDDEIWCVSGSFRHQQEVTRVFVMDEPHYFPEGFDSELNLLPLDVRVVMTRHHPSIMRSEPYPIHDVLTHFWQQRFFTSTMAYMLALAIYEGFEEIVLCGCHWKEDSAEYSDAIPCLNFWIGVGLGRGIKFGIHGPCSLALPHPWSTGLYGYETITTRKVIMDGLAATYVWASNFPRGVEKHVNIDSDEFKESLVEAQ